MHVRGGALRRGARIARSQKFPFRFRIVETRLSFVRPDGTLLRARSGGVAAVLKELPERYPQLFTVSEENSLSVRVHWMVKQCEWFQHPSELSVLLLGLVPQEERWEYLHRVHLTVLSAETEVECRFEKEKWTSLGILGFLLQTHRWPRPDGFVRIEDGGFSGRGSKSVSFSMRSPRSTEIG